MVFTVMNNTYPALYEAPGMQFYYIPYEYETVIGPEKLWSDHDNVESMFILGRTYWSLTIIVALFYSVGIHVLQRYMASREAFVLKGPLIIWNCFFALFSLVGTIRCGEELLHVLRTRPFLDSILYTTQLAQPALFWEFLFTVSKIFELGDTIFVILRKKPLIFLHWYHHATVLVLVVHCAKEAAAAARWFVFMNYVVHTLMYSYYAMAAAGIRLPRAIAMLLTTMQTTQMFIGVAISFVAFYFKIQGHIVQQSFENLFFSFAIYTSFAILFSDFFSKSYMEKETKKKTQ